ncbi:unnamed protein product [Penicillium bialowiezense]
MELLSHIVAFSIFCAVTAFPQQTPAVTTDAAPAKITQGPELICMSGQTAVYTTDCSMGTPLSYCSSPEPPITCTPGSFPSVWHPDECIEESTCFPLNAPWITTKCSNGAFPYSMSTFYRGTIAGGQSTTVTGLSCSCAQNQWTSTKTGDSGEESFCMVYETFRCPPGMDTSDMVYPTCSASPFGGCPLISVCVCADKAQTPVYPDGSGLEPTGCAY